ncbi:MAG: hypothetical protein ACI8PW_001674, partial [Methylophilaceae bacterium]
MPSTNKRTHSKSWINPTLAGLLSRVFNTRNKHVPIPVRRGPHFEALEQRFLLSADGLVPPPPNPDQMLQALEAPFNTDASALTVSGTPIQYTIQGGLQQTEFQSEEQYTDLSGVIATIPSIDQTDVSLDKFGETVDSSDVVTTQKSTSVTIDVLANHEAAEGELVASTVKITSNLEGSLLSADGKSLNVQGEGVWSVDAETGAITFSPEDGFLGKLVEIAYQVDNSEGEVITSTLSIELVDQATTAPSTQVTQIALPAYLAYAQNQPAPNQVVIVDPSVTNYDELVKSLLNAGNTGTANVTAELDANSAQDTQSGKVLTDLLSPQSTGITAPQIQVSRYGDVEVVVLDSRFDGVDQIAEILSSYHSLMAVQLISHGATGTLRLGSSQLDSNKLEQYKEQLTKWGVALRPGGDILLYGCDVAKGADGLEFVGNLAQIAGVDVAASTNMTGSAALGGDWNLEYSTGVIETQALFNADALTTYSYLLINLTGFTGDDTLISTSFADTMTGLTGDDIYQFSNGWGNDTVNEGADEGTDTLDFSAVTANLTFTVRADGTLEVSDGAGNTVVADNIEVLIGGTGSNTFFAADTDNTWDITGTDAGELNGLFSFTGIGNLTGGSGKDVFNFSDGAAISGQLDGGVGSGSNSLDYSDYKTTVTVNLALHTATGTNGALNFTDLTGGAALDDVLTGGAVDAVTLNPIDTIWRITDVDSGEVEGVISFAGIENLQGADANRDEFIFEADGSLTGTLDGGAAGSDTLVVRKGTDLDYALVNVVSDSLATVTLYDRTINFKGIEPIVSGTAANKVIAGSSFTDKLVLDSVDASSLSISTTDMSIFDVATSALITEIIFANPTTTLTFTLGRGNDQLTLGNLNAAFTASLDFDGGAGDDSLQARDIDNIWTIASLNAGTLNANGSFSNTEILLGGSLNDEFNFLNQATVDAYIDGGVGGTNTLDYHLYASAVAIELNFANRNISHVIGSANVDTIIGASAVSNNIWTINGSDLGVISSSATNTVELDSNTVIDAVNGTLQFAYAHLFSDGQKVTYHSSVGDVNGLIDSAEYYVLVVDSQTIKLTSTAASVVDLNEFVWTEGTRTLQNQAQTPVTIDPELMEGYGNSLEFSVAHGFNTGDQLGYNYVGADDNSRLTNGVVYYVLVVDEYNIKLLTSAPAVITIADTTIWSTGSSSLDHVQVFTDVSFSSFENLKGGSADDAFNFSNNVSFNGLIDGGRGVNSVDYSAYTNAVTVRIGASGISNISQIIGGGNSADTLYGPGQDALWNITAQNTGDVNGINFSDFENLTGADDYEDGFVLRAGGSISGTIIGGANGLDGLAFEDPANLGNLSVIIHELDAGTLVAGAVYAGASAVTFSGMEKPFLADLSVAREISVRGSAFDDTLTLSRVGTTVTVEETDASRTFWSYNASAFVSKSFSFEMEDNTIDIIRVDANGNDSVTFGAFDSGGANTLLSNANYIFNDNFTSRGGDIVLEADTITIAAGVTLNTRVTDGFGLSTGNSGIITLTAETVTIGNNAQLLSFDNRPSPNVDPTNVPAAIDTIAFPPVLMAAGNEATVWSPGAVFTNVATSTDADFRIANSEQVGDTVTVITTEDHALVVGQAVIISGVSVDEYNGSYTVSVVAADLRSFSYITTKTTDSKGLGGLASGAGAGMTVDIVVDANAKPQILL